MNDVNVPVWGGGLPHLSSIFSVTLSSSSTRATKKLLYLSLCALPSAAVYSWAPVAPHLHKRTSVSIRKPARASLFPLFYPGVHFHLFFHPDLSNPNYIHSLWCWESYLSWFNLVYRTLKQINQDSRLLLVSLEDHLIRSCHCHHQGPFEYMNRINSL